MVTRPARESMQSSLALGRSPVARMISLNSSRLTLIGRVRGIAHELWPWSSYALQTVMLSAKYECQPYGLTADSPPALMIR